MLFLQSKNVETNRNSTIYLLSALSLSNRALTKLKKIK